MEAEVIPSSPSFSMPAYKQDSRGLLTAQIHTENVSYIPRTEINHQMRVGVSHSLSENHKLQAKAGIEK